jgi:hypothetical protein
MGQVSSHAGITCFLLIDGKLRWQCKEGHIWEATLYHIKIENNDSKCGMPKEHRYDLGGKTKLSAVFLAFFRL